MATPTLVLWDIDHTLIETRGVGGKLYRAAFEEITGRQMEHKAAVTGKTEPAILTETLNLNGLKPSDDYQARYTEALARQYEEHADELRERGRALPGSREALAALAEQPGVIQTVLTGNLRAVAVTKLRVFGLDGFIDFEVGAYGDDAADRPKLVAVAQQRAAAKHGLEFSRSNTVILGDSPGDVETGIRGGAKIIGVATGRSSAEELRKTGAGLVFQDLTEVSQWMRWIVNDDSSQPNRESPQHGRTTPPAS
jgi:phosphoglycolate phosphatase-like HAD superfamily hydrolase